MITRVSITIPPDGSFQHVPISGYLIHVLNAPPFDAATSATIHFDGRNGDGFPVHSLAKYRSRKPFSGLFLQGRGQFDGDEVSLLIVQNPCLDITFPNRVPSSEPETAPTHAFFMDSGGNLYSIALDGTSAPVSTGRNFGTDAGFSVFNVILRWDDQSRYLFANRNLSPYKMLRYSINEEGDLSVPLELFSGTDRYAWEGYDIDRVNKLIVFHGTATAGGSIKVTNYDGFVQGVSGSDYSADAAAYIHVDPVNNVAYWTEAGGDYDCWRCEYSTDGSVLTNFVALDSIILPVSGARPSKPLYGIVDSELNLGEWIFQNQTAVGNTPFFTMDIPNASDERNTGINFYGFGFGYDRIAKRVYGVKNTGTAGNYYVVSVLTDGTDEQIHSAVFTQTVIAFDTGRLQ